VKVGDAIAPQPAQIQQFLTTEGSVLVMNLLKFREKAAYPDGRDPDLSGREMPLFTWASRQPDAREGVASFLEKRTPRWTLRPSRDRPEDV